VPVLIGGGIYYYIEWREAEAVRQAELHADITARVWMASAYYRNNPDLFHKFRDSLLARRNVTKDQVDLYLKRYEEEPEKYLLYAQLVKRKVDSLSGDKMEKDTTLNKVR